MRRALFAITGLAASTTALVVLKGAPGSTPAAAGDVPTGGQPVAPAGPAPDDTPVAGKSAPDPSARTSRSPKPGRSATEAPTRRPGTATTIRPPATSRTTAPPRSTTRTVTGPVVSNEFGNVQVQVTLSGSRIVDVVALELPETTAQSDERSDQVDGRYSGSSGLVVRQQNADLDAVSGATATSTSYRQSLQAAIDRAG
ncbi:FMN-binding domain-containing protein [Micromonospora nigra]|uniref:FMN-binding domain-containing protein n=1 Tax=Micromonospora nigra TaxID=145857 RepID=A0A1C6RI44_9ACTN|nr:FMN-binding protein [Micromonospora nigra]SCL16672.1 FMN-binding domain-containing protein [Micromonospora nigra]